MARWDSSLERVLDPWLKGCEFESQQEWREFFFFRVNFTCWCLFSVCSSPMLPQWHVKDPAHSAKSADGRLHLNMHTPLTQQSWSGLTMPLSRCSVNLSRNQLTYNLSGNTLPQSSQLAKPLWTDLGLKSGNSVRLHTCTKKSASGEWSSQARKKPPPLPTRLTGCCKSVTYSMVQTLPGLLFCKTRALAPWLWRKARLLWSPCQHTHARDSVPPPPGVQNQCSCSVSCALHLWRTATLSLCEDGNPAVIIVAGYVY